jgi:hypothetical protein
LLIESIARSPGAKKGVLCHFLCEASIAKRSPAEPVDFAAVFRVDALEPRVPERGCISRGHHESVPNVQRTCHCHGV